MREIRPMPPPDATVLVPGSKSQTNRALLLAALARGESAIEGAAAGDDVDRLADSLVRLGASVRREAGGTRLIVHGVGGRFPVRVAKLDAGASGTALRFLTAAAALGAERIEIDGDPALANRPVEPLAAALRALGAEIATGPRGGAPVVVRSAGLAGGAARVAGDRSSQFASALLLVGPALPKGLSLTVGGPLVSSPYLDLTVEAIRAFGATVDELPEARGGRGFRVAPGEYRGRAFAVEGDASAAAFLFVAAAITGGRIRVGNLPRTSRQGDLVLLDHLRRMGAAAVRGDDIAEVSGGPLSGIDVDLKDAPDLAPALAAAALFARGATRLRGAPHLRIKESDRIAAIAAGARALGGAVVEHPDGLTIEGGRPLHGGRIDPRGDHRIAMAFAVAGLVVPGVEIENPDVVAKSWPDFFADLDALRRPERRRRSR